MSTVGVIGVGQMGGALLGRLRELGHAVGFCDVDPERQRWALAQGAQLHATPADLACQLAPQGVMLVVVVDDAQTEEVLWGPQGAGPALAAGQLACLCPTLSPQAVEWHGQRLNAQGVRVLDAPMSGGPERARQGRMSWMVAGDEAALAQAQPWLQALSDAVFTIGPRLGDATRTKLVNNLLAAVALVGTAEAMALSERLGLDPAQTLRVIESSSGQNWIGSDRMRRALAGDTRPLAQARLLAKDSRLAMQAAAQAGVVPALGQQAQQAFAQLVAQCGAEVDDSAMWSWLRTVAKQP